MEEIKLFLKDRKNIATLAFLTLMVAVLPVGIALIRTSQLYNSRAAGERIQLGTGRCVVERDGKKVLICNEVPINLNAPFDPKVTPTPTPSPTPTPTPTPSPTPATSPSPTPRASAGADASLKHPMSILSALQSKLIPEAIAYDKYICTGDRTAGAGGLIDIQTNGCGEALNYEALFHSCVPNAVVQYKAPVYNTTIHQWQTIKQDGRILSEADMKEKQDSRFPIKISGPGEDPPYINCQVYFEYSGRTDCDITPQKNAAGLSMGREGTELEPGQTFTMDVHKTANPATGDPDCRQGVEVEAPPLNNRTPAPATPSPSPTSSTSPQPSSSGNPQCTGGLFAQAQIEGGNSCGTISALPAIGATSGMITYTAPTVTSDTVCTLKVLTSNNGDCKLDASGKGSAATPLKPGETINVNYSNACVDNQTGCNFPMIISSSAALPTDRSSYKLAESENGLASATEKGLPAQQFSATYTLKDSTPGMKHIWVEFFDKTTNTKTKDTLDVELVENNPVLKAASCQLDIGKTAVNFNLTGLRFGTDMATATVNGQALDVTSWTATEIKGALKNPNLVAGDQVYKVKITRKDNVSSEEVQCRLGITQISLGTQLLCRGEGKLDLSNVTLTILDENNKKTEETAAITKDGIITGLKTKFEIGKNYTISIKAPKILRRNITFKAEEGTTVITKDDGTKLQLPVGDIYPNSTSGDGQINTLDQAEIKRQWGSTNTGTNALTGDFNADSRVNAFDWSCMRTSFGLSDDPLPGAPSGGSINTEFNENNKITVQFGNPAPNPNVQPISEGSSSGTENEPKILIEGTTN